MVVSSIYSSTIIFPFVPSGSSAAKPTPPQRLEYCTQAQLNGPSHAPHQQTSAEYDLVGQEVTFHLFAPPPEGYLASEEWHPMILTSSQAPWFLE